MKGNKGITLIALVITIIVLLILAGVSIAMLSGDNSILGRSREAGYKTIIASAKEQVNVKVNEAMTDYYNKVYSTNTPESRSIGEFVTAALATYPGNASSDGITYTAPVWGAEQKKTTTKLKIVYNGDTSKYAEAEIAEDGKVTWDDTKWNPAPAANPQG